MLCRGSFHWSTHSKTSCPPRWTVSEDGCRAPPIPCALLQCDNATPPTRMWHSPCLPHPCPLLWDRAGSETCFDLENVVEVTQSSDRGSFRKGPCGFCVCPLGNQPPRPEALDNPLNNEKDRLHRKTDRAEENPPTLASRQWPGGSRARSRQCPEAPAAESPHRPGAQNRSVDRAVVLSQEAQGGYTATGN